MVTQPILGARVTTSGFPGTVVRICEWSRSPGSTEVMVEVRLASGLVCVSSTDLE